MNIIYRLLSPKHIHGLRLVLSSLVNLRELDVAKHDALASGRISAKTHDFIIRWIQGHGGRYPSGDTIQGVVNTLNGEQTSIFFSHMRGDQVATLVFIWWIFELIITTVVLVMWLKKHRKRIRSL